MPKPLLYTRLKDRKLVQWALAYLAGAFVVVQALEVLEGPWALPARLVQAVHVLLVAGFFLALVIAWYHGERGQQRATQVELIIVTLLLIITGGVIRVVWGAGGWAASVARPTGHEHIASLSQAPQKAPSSTLRTEDSLSLQTAALWYTGGLRREASGAYGYGSSTRSRLACFGELRGLKSRSFPPTENAFVGDVSRPTAPLPRSGQ